MSSEAETWKQAYMDETKKFQAETLRASNLARIVAEVATKNCRHPLSSLGGTKTCLEAKRKHAKWGRVCLPCQAREALGQHDLVVRKTTPTIPKRNP